MSTSVDGLTCTRIGRPSASCDRPRHGWSRTLSSTRLMAPLNGRPPFRQSGERWQASWKDRRAAGGDVGYQPDSP